VIIRAQHSAKTIAKTWCFTAYPVLNGLDKLQNSASIRPSYIFSKRHGVSLGPRPKLAARYFNMNSKNAYKVYCVLHKKRHPDRKLMPLRECINNLTQSLLQQGLGMRLRGYGAPPSATKDVSTSSSCEGRSIRSDSNRPPARSRSNLFFLNTPRRCAIAKNSLKY
jgi:hypothetical protein